MPGCDADTNAPADLRVGQRFDSGPRAMAMKMAESVAPFLPVYLDL
jgi:hypothetical protein